MSEQESIELFRRIRESIRGAQIKMLERKALLGEPVVVADAKGLPLVITAEEALRHFRDIDSNCLR